ncbi:hypothetical protein T07_4701 [Trichinella nelsoni]|uniref:Transmembrane protein n=1 Tax=Trichinella nelsoni TaxID=6336 RepID=A0A0V0S169_9BILA|nr:hypothetical protein T07_4701 [Trichinella nelsoni]
MKVDVWKTKAKSRNSKEQIHKKHGLLINKDEKHVNGGSSESTLIFSVMYHRNVNGRSSSDIRALLITSFIGRVSFVNNVWRELKETRSSNWKILWQAILFGVSEKRLHGQIFDETRRDTNPVVINSCVTACILTDALNFVTFVSEGSPSDPAALLIAGTLSFVSEVFRSTLLLLVVKSAS